jgi:hypothetical protein
MFDSPSAVTTERDGYDSLATRIPSLVADYLIGEPPQQASFLTPQQSLVEKGKKYFQELNCAARHALAGFIAAPYVGSLKHGDFSRGCLSESDPRGPRFHLNDAR